MGALIFQGEQVLLVQRGREPLKGQWSLPGGVVETGETLASAIIREVKEETGLDVVPREVAVVFERIMNDSAGQPEYHYVLVDYVCEVTGGRLCAGDDSASAEWIALDRLHSLPMTEGTVGVIERYRQQGPSLTVASA